MKPSIALIGPGKVGCAVGRHLHDSGYPMVAVIGRDRQRTVDACNFIGCSKTVAGLDLQSAARAKLILLAVPDDQLEIQAKELQTTIELSAEQILIHFSGLHPASLLRAENSTAHHLSIHPLLPFADRQLAYEKLSGCPCALEGDQNALPLGRQLITDLGATAFTIESDSKALYHASACIASNFMVTLLAVARDLLIECGIDRQKAISLLLPLVQANLDNTKKLGPEAGLTGPIVRGDRGTVQHHLHALKESTPELLPFYRLLGEKTIELAVKSGRLSPEQSKNLL